MNHELGDGTSNSLAGTTGVIVPSWQAVMQTPAIPPPAMPDPISLLNALRRRWRLALVLGISLSIVTASLVFVEMPPPKYKAQSLLQVATEAPRVVLETKETQTDFRTYQKTQEAYIHSRLVLDAAIAMKGVKTLSLIQKQADPLLWLEKQIKVDFAFGSEILRIEMIGEEPYSLAEIVNAVTQSYLEQVVDAEFKKRVDRQKLLKKNWDHYQERLREKRAMVKRLGEQAGSNDKQALAVVHQSEQDRLARAEDSLARVQSELRALDIDIAMLEKRSVLGQRRVSERDVEAQVATDPEVTEFAQRLAQLQLMQEGFRRVARSSADPGLIEIRRSMRATRKAMEKKIAILRPSITARLGKTQGEDTRIDLELARGRNEVLQRQEAELKDEVKRLGEHARMITRTSVDLASIQEEIFAADEIARKLAVEIESLNVELQAPPRVRLIQKAEVPHETDRNRVVKIAGGAGASVLFMTLGLVALWEFRARKIESVHEIESKMGIRVLGSLPALPSIRLTPSADPRELQASWNHQLIDSVDAARTAVLHAARIGKLSALMVTGSESDEGKASFSCHLAASLARAGRKTLLIDFDLRNPSMHKVFDIEEGPGVSEILRGEASSREVAINIGDSSLWVIPAGRLDRTAVGSMARDEVRLLFEEARKWFSFIVIDAAPVLQVTDALQVGQHVDAAILSVMRGVSRGPSVYSACRRLATMGIPLFGAIVVDSQESQDSDTNLLPAEA